MGRPRHALQPIPAETARVAQAAFPAGTVSMRIRDEVGALVDELFTAVSAIEGQPAIHPWQVALVSVMPFAEDLSDRQAAEAVRARIDWTYALGLERTEEGFHYSVLCECRARLVQGGIERVLLDTLLDTLRRWLRQRGVALLRLDTLRMRLVKIGGWVHTQVEGFRLHLASSHLAEPLWRLLAARFQAP